LKRTYQALLDANVGLEETNKWLDSEDEILEKAPLLDREKIKVGLLSELTRSCIDTVVGLEGYLE
jgi:hypothetical protein